MPASKSTATISGVASDAYVTLDQYGIRSEMALATATLTTTHRQSSGLNRTLTLSANHGMVPGEAFMVLGCGGTAYNCYESMTPMPSLFVVASVPAADKITYYGPSSVSEAITADTGGKVFKLGWSSLRVGMRYALPRASSWTAVSCAFGLGVSHGSYAVGSPLCDRWVGATNGDNTTLNRVDATPDYLLTGVSSKELATVKGGTQWFTIAGSTSVVRFPIEQASPGLLVVEYCPYTSGSTPVMRMSAVSVVTGNTAVLASDLRAFLRHPDLFHVSTPAGYTVERNTYDFSSTSFWHWYPTSGNVPKYIEAFCRSATQTLEIMDLGYAFTL